MSTKPLDGLRRVARDMRRVVKLSESIDAKRRELLAESDPAKRRQIEKEITALIDQLGKG
jgi:hypothetical protein